MKLIKLILLLFPTICFGQVTTVEVYGTVPAIQVYNGLGSNLTQTNAWEYTALHAIHGTWARSDCGWTGVESPKGTFSMPSGCTAALTNAAANSVHQMFDALYGPTFTTIASGTVTSNVSSGATTVSITVTSGSLSTAVAGQTELLISPQWSSKASYPGALITGIAGSTLTMAAASTSAFTSGTAVQVNLLYYPPVLIPSGQGYRAYQSNASVQAYVTYANYLATQIAAAGQTGQVSLWNEPPWGGDPWDQAGNLYDTPPSNGYIEGGSPGLGVEIPLYLANLGTPVTGVPYDNGYPEVVGLNGDLFYSNLIPYQQSISNLKAVFGSESFHPYGNNPEDALWLGTSCLIANLSNLTNLLNNCTPTGGVIGSAEKLAVAENIYPHNFGGLQHEITETGICRCNSPTPSETQVARFNMRQFLGFQSIGVTPIMFYRMFGDSNWQWFTNSTTPLPVYTAFQRLMTDIGTIANSPVATYSPCMMPRISSYTSTPAGYPLMTLTLVGSQSGNRENSLLYFTWQRSNSTSPNWESLSSPATVNVSVVIPNGLTVSAVNDLIAGTSVSFTFASQVLTYPVSDNPIDILLVPVSPSTTSSLKCT